MLDFFGYYQEGAEKKKQKGVIRTNSLLSLERTNLMQSKIALSLIKKQLAIHEVDPYKEDNILNRFNEVWADNGEQLTSQYVESNVLNTDSINLCTHILLKGSTIYL
jgi:hypothetical protein